MRSFLILAITLSSFSALAQVKQVSGYVKSNGTYVAPYIRTSPNGTTYDNIKPRK